jgi:hypothetical protein
VICELAVNIVVTRLETPVETLGFQQGFVSTHMIVLAKGGFNEPLQKILTGNNNFSRHYWLENIYLYQNVINDPVSSNWVRRTLL